MPTVSLERRETMKIAEYKFNSDTDTLPTFNSGFTYEYADVDNGNGTITRTIASDSLPSSINFIGKTGLVSLSYLDTSNVADMTRMFYNCTNLSSIDLSSFDTSNATNMSWMFSSCHKLTSLDLSSFDTSNVTNMGYMFYNCKNLTSIDLSSFDTSKVTTMSSIFSDCSSLTSVNMKNSNANSVNKIINQLPTRTMDSTGLLNIAGVDNESQVDEATANSKYWLISLAKTTVNNIGIGGINISELYIGPAGVKQVYLGDILIYENKEVVNDKIIMYNENINTLFILGDGLLQYDEQNLNLNISDDLNIIYDEEESNLTIGGEE